jgi:tetratricopeptide (TPR) repeat protein
VSRALNSQRKALEIRQSLVQANPSDLDLLRDLAQAFTRVGFRFGALGRFTKVEENFRQALESQRQSLSIRERLAAADATNALDRRRLADQIMIYADAQLKNGKTVEAFMNYHRSEAMFKALSENDPYNLEAQRDLENIYYKLASASNEAGNKSAAKQNYRIVVDIAQRLLAVDPAGLEDMQMLSAVFQKLTEIAISEGALSDAIKDYQQAVEIFERVAAVQQTDSARLYEANGYERLAGLYANYADRGRLGLRQVAENCRHSFEWHQKYLQISPELISRGLPLNPTPAMSARQVLRCQQAMAGGSGTF